MAWRVAKSLLTLRDQVNALAPGRDKSSDGTIGDEAHQSRNSDHNPNADGVVTAMDITHDPSHGVDSGALAEMLRIAQDPRIKYVISNRRIFSSKISPWRWRPYDGANAHTKHVHVSVLNDSSLYDNTQPWAVDIVAKTSDAARARSEKSCTGIIATVFGGQADPNRSAYDNHFISDDELGVALPGRLTGERPKVRVTNTQTAKSVICDIVDIGPWNTSDPYWEFDARPQAETGFDRAGRKTNLAGIDLTPAAALAVGIAGKGKVNWEFVGPEEDMAKGELKMSTPVSDIIAQLQQVVAVLQTMDTQTKQGAVQPAPVLSEQLGKITDALNAILKTSGVAPLGQVNGALGQGIGNLLDGKKTAIGIFGALATDILSKVGPSVDVAKLLGSAATTGAAGVGLGQIAMPVFLALSAWGLLGKFEKWFQDSGPPPQ